MFFQVLPPSFCSIFYLYFSLKIKCSQSNIVGMFVALFRYDLVVVLQAVFDEAPQKIKFEDRNVESRYRLLRE